MSGGTSLWRANWSESDDPFAHVSRDRPDKSAARGPGWQRALGNRLRNEAGTGHRTGPLRRQLRCQTTRDVAVGDRVFHDKFGYGEVLSQEGNKLEIDFEKAGTKRVIDSFVKLAH